MFKRRKRRKARRRALTVFILLAVLVLYAFNYSNSKVIADEYEVSLAGLPAAFEGYLIAIISDVHGNTFGEGNEDLLTPLRESRPDIIAITGDICDRKYPHDAIYGLLTQLVMGVVERQTTLDYYIRALAGENDKKIEPLLKGKSSIFYIIRLLLLKELKRKKKY